MKKKNKGVSLVEVIIVVAIMAILIGMVAANVVRYIEKAHVSSDLRLLDEISAAVTYALMDPAVIKDPTSDVPVALMDAATTYGVSLSQLADPDGNKVAEEVMLTLGWNSLDPGDYMKYIKSQHTGASDIYIQHKGGAFTPYAVWVTYTDSSGRRDCSDGSTTWEGIEKCVCAQ